MPVMTALALVGSLAGLWLPVFESVYVIPLSLLAGGIVVWWFVGSAPLCGLVLFAVSSLHSHLYLQQLLPEGLVKQDVALIGQVEGFPRAGDGITTFLFAVEDGEFRGRYRLRVYGDEPAPSAGQVWRLKVRLKKPLSTVNRAGFDQETWYLWNRIRGTGYVRTSILNTLVSEPDPRGSVLSWRIRVRDRIESITSDSRVRALLFGIVIGARDAIDANTWDLLRSTGTAHLMAISGMHIGLMALFAWFPGRLLGWLLVCAKTIADPLVIARLASFGSAAVYASLAGGSIPTLRALCMVGIATVFAFQRRQIPVHRVLALTLLIMLVWDPLAILSPGFWLSFAAVAILAAVITDADAPYGASASLKQRWASRIGRAVHSLCAVQMRLSFGLALPLALLFGQVSLVTLIANLIAVPVFSAMVLPPALAGGALLLTGIPGGAAALELAGHMLGWLLVPLEWIAGWPAAIWYSGEIGGLTLVIVAAGLALLLLPRPVPGLWLGPTVICFGLLSNEPIPVKGLRLAVLDVGQGLAVLLQTARHSLIYDAGAKWRGGDAGQSVLLPVIRAAGIRELDVLVVSHADTDHSGGALSLVREINVAKVITPRATASELPRATECTAGTKWEWDGVRFQVLHPADASVWSDNNASCVLLVEYRGTRVLLPGDIEMPAESALVDAKFVPEVDLLIGPHHGSKTSSSEAFVKQSSPDYVVFSAGYANRWQLPVPFIVERWVSAGACALTTQATGAIEFLSDEAGFRLHRVERSVMRRPWVLRNADAGQCAGTINRPDTAL